MLEVETPPTSRRSGEPSDGQLAADLGHVLESLMDRTAHGVLVQIAAHGVTPSELRVLRELHRGPGTCSLLELAEQTDLDDEAVRDLLRALLQRDLVIQRAGRIGLTRQGRRIVQDVERARRADLRAFVAELDHGSRLRVEAAVHLLLGDLDLLAA